MAQRVHAISYLPGQGRLLSATLAHLLFVAGVGAGKTEGGARWTLKRIVQEPWAVGFIGAQTHAQLARISLPPLLRLLSEAGIVFVMNKAPPPTWGPSRFAEHGGILSVLIPGAARPAQVITGSMENYDAHRGLSIGWYWLDEARDMAEAAYDVILSRLRGQSLWEGPGQVTSYGGILTTTPNGFGWLHKRFVAEPVAGSQVVRARTTENPFLPAGFVEGLRAQYTERYARQELDGEFLNMTAGQAYYAFRRERHISATVADPLGPMWYSADFNVSPLCAVYGQADNRIVHVTGEIYIQGSGNTREAVGEFCRRHAGHKRKHVTVYGDMSGGNRDTRSGTTDYGIIEEELRRSGWDVLIRRNYQNPPLAESVEAVNAVLEHQRIVLDPSARRTAKDLEQVAWKEGTRILAKDNPELTHCSDALRYFLAAEFPLPGRGAGWGSSAVVGFAN